MFLLSYSLLLDKTFKNQNQDGINIIYINRKLWNWRLIYPSIENKLNEYILISNVFMLNVFVIGN